MGHSKQVQGACENGCRTAKIDLDNKRATTTPAVNTELHANRANEVNEKAQFLAAA